MALTLNGSDPTGDLGDLLDAKLNLAGGKILQIVRATDATDRSTTSTSFVDATNSVTITPQKSTSAIIILATGGWECSLAGDLVNRGRLQITDNSNNTISGAQQIIYGLNNINGSNNRQSFGGFSIFAYATPATISATTYKLRFLSDNASTTFKLNNGLATGQMYAIEVSA